MENDSRIIFNVSAEDFKIIPGSRIAYWASDSVRKCFLEASIGNVIEVKEGITTGNNDMFLRQWFEVSITNCFNQGARWRPCNKGGEYRKWYGNREYVIDWDMEGKKLRDYARSTFRNERFQFQEGGTFSNLTTGMFSARYAESGFAFESKGPMLFTKELRYVIAYMNSAVFNHLIQFLAPTLDYKLGVVKQIPLKLIADDIKKAEEIADQIIDISRSDWDEYETSWDFKVNPLVREGWQRGGAAMSLETAWAAVFARRMEWTERMKALEEENNRLFIEAYGLQDELSPDVAWKDVSITGNPAYRYKLDGDQQSGEELARADAMRELISYGMGVLMGRYSLEQEGLILASQGELYKDYIARVHGAGKILPDEDGVIPAIALEGGFFKDNLLHRMREFLSAAFGNDALPQNLNFIEAALGCGFDKYLTDKFFDDHVKTYKKRPIYWLFESPKGYFRAFAYMHRMTGATAGHIRNNYLLPYIGHLEKCFAAEVAKGSAMTSAERKRVKAMEAAIKDCKAYDLVLHDFADQSVAIDLDDGVVVNWKKYESVLAKL